MISPIKLLGIALLTLLVASGVAAAAGPAAAVGDRTARGPGTGVGPAADVVRPLDGHNSPWVTGDVRLDRFQARFDLTDEQLAELRADVSAMILDGADHDAVQAEILTMLEQFGVEDPALGPMVGVPLGDGPQYLGPNGPGYGGQNGPADGRFDGVGAPGVASNGSVGGVGPNGPADGSCVG